jgi:hypothetical protein
VFDLFSNVTMRNIKNTRLRKQFDWIFDLSPTYHVILSQQHYDSVSGGELNNSKLTRVGGKIGLGPEIGIEIPVGYLFMILQYIPGYEYLWYQTHSKRSTSNGLISEVMLETGYSFFISKNVNIRLFSSITGTDNDNKKNAINKTSSNKITDMSGSEYRYGISIGYYSPQIKSTIKSLFY